MTSDAHTDTPILIDKPLRWTSFDVVRKVRAALPRDPVHGRRAKVGHAGTLDPLATGLLILCTGTLTKRIPEFQQMEKEYTGTFFLGAETPSYDLETEPVHGFPTGHIDENLLKKTAAAFTGTIRQVPPAHSAVLVGGRRAYEKARKGQAVALESRPVEIHAFDIVHVDGPRVDFRVVCSKGTYIRSLAHDFGRALGSAAYLQALRRTRIGPYRVEDAVVPDAFTPRDNPPA